MSWEAPASRRAARPAGARLSTRSPSAHGRCRIGMASCTARSWRSNRSGGCATRGAVAPSNRGEWDPGADEERRHPVPARARRLHGQGHVRTSTARTRAGVTVASVCGPCVRSSPEEAGRAHGGPPRGGLEPRTTDRGRCREAGGQCSQASTHVRPAPAPRAHHRLGGCGQPPPGAALHGLSRVFRPRVAHGAPLAQRNPTFGKVSVGFCPLRSAARLNRPRITRRDPSAGP